MYALVRFSLILCYALLLKASVYCIIGLYEATAYIYTNIHNSGGDDSRKIVPGWLETSTFELPIALLLQQA